MRHRVFPVADSSSTKLHSKCRYDVNERINWQELSFTQENNWIGKSLTSHRKVNAHSEHRAHHILLIFIKSLNEKCVSDSNTSRHSTLLLTLFLYTF